MERDLRGLQSNMFPKRESTILFWFSVTFMKHLLHLVLFSFPKAGPDGVLFTEKE